MLQWVAPQWTALYDGRAPEVTFLFAYSICVSHRGGTFRPGNRLQKIGEPSMSYYSKPRPDRRCVRRWNVLWPATVTIEGRDYPCTILDLSELGARIEAHGVPYGPVPATLQSERFGSLEGRIHWARGAGAGLRFEAAPEAVMQLLKPLVPGLGRRTNAIEPPPAVPQRSLRQMLRAKLIRAT